MDVNKVNILFLRDYKKEFFDVPKNAYLNYTPVNLINKKGLYPITEFSRYDPITLIKHKVFIYKSSCYYHYTPKDYRTLPVWGVTSLIGVLPPSPSGVIAFADTCASSTSYASALRGTVNVVVLVMPEPMPCTSAGMPRVRLLKSGALETTTEVGAQDPLPPGSASSSGMVRLVSREPTVRPGPLPSS